MKFYCLLIFCSTAILSYGQTTISFEEKDYSFLEKCFLPVEHRKDEMCDTLKDGKYACFFTRDGQQLFLFESKNGKLEKNAFLFFESDIINLIPYLATTDKQFPVDNFTLYYSFSFKEGEYNGTQTRYHKNTISAFTSEYIEGKRNGISREYHQNGQLLTSLNYKNDKKIDQPLTFYYDNGQVQSTGSLNNDHCWGQWKYYYRNGQLITKGERGAKLNNYNVGVRFGKWTFYKNDGTLLEIVKIEPKEQIAFHPLQIKESYEVKHGETALLMNQTGIIVPILEDWIQQWYLPSYEIASRQNINR